MYQRQVLLRFAFAMVVATFVNSRHGWNIENVKRDNTVNALSVNKPVFAPETPIPQTPTTLAMAVAAIRPAGNGASSGFSSDTILSWLVRRHSARSLGVFLAAKVVLRASFRPFPVDKHKLSQNNKQRKRIIESSLFSPTTSGTKCEAKVIECHR